MNFFLAAALTSRFGAFARARGMSGIALATAFLLAADWPCSARADWPEILGPTRNGYVSDGSELPSSVSANLAPVWQIDAGQGYAGAAIRSGAAALFQREGDEDILRLVSLADGKVRWRTAFPATYRRGIDPDAGPRCVPQILEDCVLVHAASGAVHCVELADGSVRWSRALRKEYGAEDGYFGAGTAPLVVGQRVIVNVGAKKKGAGIVAISLADGKTLWQSTEADAGYASPILMPSSGEGRAAGGVAVVPTRLTTYGVDVETGKVLWEFPFGQRGPTVNAATPIPLSPHSLLQTSSYGIGYITVDLGSGGAKILAEGMELASQYASPVAVGGLVFGADGREDAGGASYKCLDPLQGKIRWESTGLPICHTIVFGNGVIGDGKALVDGKGDAPASATLLLVGIDGQLGAAPASADGLQWKWKSRLPAGVYRALPAWSSGRLVVRTTGDRGAKWYCFEL